MQKSSTSPGKYYKNAFLSHRVQCCIGDGCVQSASFVICRVMDTRSVIFCQGLLVRIPLSVLIIWQCNWRWRFQFYVNQCLESVCLVPALFDDEYVVDPYAVKLHSKTKSSIKGHMFGPHLVEVRCMTKSSDEGRMFGPHLVEVCSETKSSDEGHILDHIWSKSAVRQSPPMRGTFWTTFGWSPLHDKVLPRGAHFGPHLVKVHSETKSSNEGHILDHI